MTLYLNCLERTILMKLISYVKMRNVNQNSINLRNNRRLTNRYLKISQVKMNIAVLLTKIILKSLWVIKNYEKNVKRKKQSHHSSKKCQKNTVARNYIKPL